MISRRIISELRRKWIIQYPCGCAFLLETNEQICYCPNCPIQLELFEVN